MEKKNYKITRSLPIKLFSFVYSLCLSLCLSVSICPHLSLSLSFLSHTHTLQHTHIILFSLLSRFLLPYRFEITKKVYEFCNKRKKLSPNFLVKLKLFTCNIIYSLNCDPLLLVVKTIYVH